jgi:hypothetical protein
MTVEEIYHQKCAEPSDINEHLPTLRKYASECGHVTEFGVRGIVSTWALLAGHPHDMVSYDITNPGDVEIADVVYLADAQGTLFRFICADVRRVEIEFTELLFIDTYHTYSQLREELSLHASKVGKYIILHDTFTFGEHGEASSEKGLLPALREFLEANPLWVIKEQFVNNNGLTVIQRI